MYENNLPMTGVGLTVDGHYVSLSALLIVAVALVAIGVGIVRVTSRGKRRDRI